MDGVVAPVDQVLPLALEEVNVTLPPAQKEVAPLAEIVGAAGSASTVTATGGELNEKQPLALAYETE